MQGPGSRGPESPTIKMKSLFTKTFFFRSNNINQTLTTALSPLIAFHWSEAAIPIPFGHPNTSKKMIPKRKSLCRCLAESVTHSLGLSPGGGVVD